WGTRCPARAAPPVSPGVRRSGGSRRRVAARASARSWLRMDHVECGSGFSRELFGKDALQARRSSRLKPLPQERIGLYRVGALRTGLQAGLQARLDELVQVAIQHLLRVRTLDAGAQVLDPALVEDVVADLAAPADVGFGGFQRVALGVALLHLQLVQL